MKHYLRPTLTAAALAVALGITAGVQAQTSATGGTVDKPKASYLAGYQAGAQLPPLMRQNIDPAQATRGFQAAIAGQKPEMSEAEADTVWKTFMTDLQTKAKAEFEQVSAKNKADGDKFLAANKSKPGVKTTASGLQYQVITQGTGARPGPNDTVKVTYDGTFVTGETFDSSSKNNPPGPTAIPLAHVIPGFREGLQLMQVGGHYKLFIPASLAYGSQPQRQFPPNETLIFDVTLVSTGPTAAAPQGGPGGGAPGGGQDGQ